MIIHLVLGVFCMVIGLGVLGYHLYEAYQENLAHVQSLPSERHERWFFMFFLGLVPMIAGIAFVAAWWQSGSIAPPLTMSVTATSMPL